MGRAGGGHHTPLLALIRAETRPELPGRPVLLVMVLVVVGSHGAVAALPGLSPPGSVCSGCDLGQTKAAFCYAIAYFEFLSREKAILVCLRHFLQVTALHMHITAQW